MQPLCARLTLDHGSTIIRRVANTASALARDATSTCGRCVEAGIGGRRTIEGVSEEIVKSLAMWTGARVGELRGSLCPALVMRFQCVLRGTFYAC
jgi:hypothetical protein